MTFDITIWSVGDDAPRYQIGNRQGNGEEALRAAVLSTGARTTLLLLPSERALPLLIEVPARSRRLLARALPFAVEEKLAVDLDAVHIAHGDLVPGVPTTVRIVDRAYLDTELARLRDWGLDVVSVQVDAERVPGQADLNVLVDADRALIRERSGKGLAVAREQLPFALALAARTQRTTELHVEVAVSDAAPLGADEFAALGQALPDSARIASPRACGIALSALVDEHSVAGIELLQGAYAPVRDVSLSLGPWRAVAIAAGAWLIVQIALNVGQAWWLGRHADQTQAAAAALYKTIFPNETPADIRLALQNHLGQGGPALGARPMLGILATAVGNDEGITLESLSYQRDRDELGVQLLARNLADLDRLKQTIERAAVQAQINSAEQEENRVRARLRIRHGGQPG